MFLNMKIVHPTNSAETEIAVPEQMLMCDIFSLLVEHGFLLSWDSRQFSSVNLTQHCKPLDNNKSVKNNGIEDNDTIVIIMSV